MAPVIITLAIKTGRVFTAVTVNNIRNRCTVALADGSGKLFVRGTGGASIRQAAFDGVGLGYRTLRGLVDDYPGAVRDREYDA